MIQKNWISVIIPVYKVEKYVEKCIRSVMENTYQNIEIICIDDGSPDFSGSFLDRLAKEENRIVVLHQKNKGVGAARNIGLVIAVGEYVVFIDPDDYIHPAMFITMLRCIQSTGANIITCNAEKIIEGTEIEHVENKGIQFDQMDAETFFNSYYARHMVTGKLYRKQDIEKYRFASDVKYGEDTLFNLCVISGISNPIVYGTTTPFYYYLMRDSSISHTSTTGDLMDFGEWYDGHRAECKSSISSWKWMLPMQAIKMTLSFRFYAIIDNCEKPLIKRANRVLHSCYHDIFTDPTITGKQKILHAVMIYFPSVYKKFRLNNDPTLKAWERNARKKSLTTKDRRIKTNH